MENISALLSPQLFLMGMQPPNLPSVDSSTGDVFSFVDEYLRSLNISNEDLEAYGIATIVFISIYGDEHGSVLFGQFLS